ncbi:MAG: DUF3307 domain-containing protein [Anaerolineales bacterium]
MFWFLFFSHLIGDYPLQPEWMARNKEKLGVLLIHVSVHLVVLLTLAGEARTLLWPYLLILTVTHFGIDFGKLKLQKYRPNWNIRLYTIDQSFHLTSIALIAFLVEREYAGMILPVSSDFFIYASGYLLVTYVWYISERVMVVSNTEYRKEVIRTAWTRMASRALLVTVFLFGFGQGLPGAFLAGAAIHWPYNSNKFALRALLTDALAAVSGTLFILLFR